MVLDDCLAPAQEYVTYPYHTAHPVLQWLPTKLAEWISSNLDNELNIPAKQDDLWTAAELNAIITGNLVGGGTATYTHLDVYSGSGSYSMEDLRSDDILLKWTAIV